MTRYSTIIGYLLAWQLLMPVLCFFMSATWWIAAVTAVIYIALLISKDWERDSYSKYSAVSVLVMSLTLTVFCFKVPNESIISLVIVFWIYSQIAFTATSPYPLSVRMPVIIYTLAFIFMIPQNSSPFIVTSMALIFSVVMVYLAIGWKAKSKSLTIASGPPEPPYSFSLATAIVAAVAINLCLTIVEYELPRTGSFQLTSKIIGGCLLSIICVWLLCTKDWQKNALAVTALVLMITLHVITAIKDLTNFTNLTSITFILSVTPVMFHTTAPVFRGMRIVITLYAVYSALNRNALVITLSDSHSSLCQQHAIVIAIDGVITIVLFLMAIHWKNNNRSGSGTSGLKEMS